MSIESTRLRYGLQGEPKYTDMQRIIVQALKEDADKFVVHPSSTPGGALVRFTLSPAEGIELNSALTTRMKYVVAELRNLGMRNIAFRTLKKEQEGAIARKNIEGYTIVIPVETNLGLKMDEDGLRPVHVRNEVLDALVDLMNRKPIQLFADLYEDLTKVEGLSVTPALVTEAIRSGTAHGLIFAMATQMPRADEDDALFMESRTYVVNASLRYMSEANRVAAGVKRQGHALHSVLREGINTMFLQDREQRARPRVSKKAAKTVPSKRVRTERTRSVEAGQRMSR